MQSQPIHSPPMPFQLESNNYSRTWGSMDSSMTCSQNSPSQRDSPVSVDGHASPYSFTNERCSSPVSTESYTNTDTQYPVSGLPVELVTSIDHYLRSILKPEAFASSHQQLNPTIWNTDTIDIDPILTKPESPVSDTTLNSRLKSCTDFLPAVVTLFMASRKWPIIRERPDESLSVYPSLRIRSTRLPVATFCCILACFFYTFAFLSCALLTIDEQ